MEERDDMASSPKEYGLAEAKAQLSFLVSQAQNYGIESVITVYNRPVAKITPIDKPQEKEPSSRGILAAYADASKIALEEGAWERAVVKKYEASRR